MTISLSIKSHYTNFYKYLPYNINSENQTRHRHKSTFETVTSSVKDLTLLTNYQVLGFFKAAK